MIQHPSLRAALAQARAAGARPFEIFATGKAWIDAERLRLRGLVIEADGALQSQGLRRDREAHKRAKRPRGKSPADTEAEAAQELKTAGHYHSHLMSLRAAAFGKIRAKQEERAELQQ